MKKSLLLTILFFTIVFAQTGARYLIIADPDYAEVLIPLADWKTQKGYKAKIVTTAETGTDSTEIRAFLINAYNTWDIQPEYLLLVGNNWQIPFPRLVYNTVGVNTDAYYGNVTDDFHNDIIPGRFWAYDTFDVKTLVSKILGYEKTPYLDDPLWFRKGVTIANEYEPGMPSSAAVYWADARYAHLLMNSAGFVHIDSFSYDYGHNHLDVMNAWDEGRSYILYRGNGFVIWEFPFMEINVNMLNNGFMLPVIISATCATIEGIGYEWTNAGTPDEPKGAVGFFGTTTGLMNAAEMRSALARGTLTSIFTDSLSTLGRAAEAGRLQYVSEFGDLLEYYSWNILGDPEMTLWTTTPQIIEVTHDTLLHVGLCTVTVYVAQSSIPVENALVCVHARRDTTYYHYGRTNSTGIAEFIDTLHIPGDTVTVTVTGRNLLPYCKSLRVYHDGGPYVLLSSYSLSDAIGGNNDSLVNPGEDIEVPVWLRNFGDSTAFDVSAIIHEAEPDAYISLHDTIKQFGTIQPYDSAFTSTDGYNVIIANDCPDLHRVLLELAISDDNNTTWISDFAFAVHAPVLEVSDYYFEQYRKSITIGDTSDLIVELLNVGSYHAENVVGELVCNDPVITVLDDVAWFGTVQPDSGAGSNASNPFVVTADSTTPGHPVNFVLVLTSGAYVDSIALVGYVGQKDFLIWDPDPNQTSGPVIRTCLDSLQFIGDYVTTFPFDSLTLYRAVFICAGVYPDNYVIFDTSRAAQEIEDYLQLQGGKLYLEGGDVWCGDPQSQHGYNFCSMFAIVPVSNTIGLFPSVEGCSTTFTEDMYFPYSGEATLIDNITAAVGGTVIFRNTRNGYGCAVAANRTTVGMSFELGGLVDTLSSTKQTLLDSIMNYLQVIPTDVQERTSYNSRMQPYIVVQPNPAFRRVRISYGGIHPSEEIDVHVYDITGRQVKKMTFHSCGRSAEHTYWNGMDENDRYVPQGIYFIRLRTHDNDKTQKVIFLR